MTGHHRKPYFILVGLIFVLLALGAVADQTGDQMVGLLWGVVFAVMIWSLMKLAYPERKPS